MTRPLVYEVDRTARTVRVYGRDVDLDESQLQELASALVEVDARDEAAIEAADWRRESGGEW